MSFIILLAVVILCVACCKYGDTSIICFIGCLIIYVLEYELFVIFGFNAWFFNMISDYVKIDSATGSSSSTCVLQMNNEVHESSLLDLNSYPLFSSDDMI